MNLFSYHTKNTKEKQEPHDKWMQEEEGIEQGEDRLSELIKRLVVDNRSSDIIEVIQDKEYRRKLYKEYDIL